MVCLGEGPLLSTTAQVQLEEEEEDGTLKALRCRDRNTTLP